MKRNLPCVSIELLKALEPKIKELLKKPEVWKTLDVDYFPPRVERLYTNIGDYRIYLHYIHETDERCLFHKHRWPAAFKQLSGAYEMGITYSEAEIGTEEAEKLPVIARFLIADGSYYEMTQTDCLHYVRPIGGDSSSIMITKDLYPEAETRKEALDRRLVPLEADRKRVLLEFFNRIF
jgi:hypothetical protein